MTHYRKGRDGKFAGSTPAGKSTAPTPADTPPTVATDPAATSGTATVEGAYAGYMAMRTPGVIRIEPETCPACRQFVALDDGHTCPPEDLRRYAVAEDTATAALYDARYTAQTSLSNQADQVRRAAGQDYDRVHGGGHRWDGSLEDAQAMLAEHIEEAEAAGDRYLPRLGRYASMTSVAEGKAMLTRLAAAQAQVRQISADIHAADQRYDRFGWSRAFLVVTNGSGGHVHSSMNCSTCFETTRYVWLPQYSGGTEDTIVADAGERCCTICYSTAPVDVLSRPTRIYSDEERAAFAAREERAAERERKRAERAAKAATADGSELVVVTEEGVHPDTHWQERLRGQAYQRKESFKTERAAVMWATDMLARGYRQPTDTERRAVDDIAASIADKRGVAATEVRAEIEAKAEAKRRRNG